MELYYSVASPFVRKVLVVAHELGCADEIHLLDAAANPVDTNMTIATHNPLGQVPTLLTHDGGALYDSRVICEYLDSRFNGALFLQGKARWEALLQQSQADGLLNAALLARYERVLRPSALQWDAWEDGQLRKIGRTLDLLEQGVGGWSERVNIGTISVGCALGYLDFRFPDLDWREARPALSDWFETFGQRPSMQQTVPRG